MLWLRSSLSTSHLLCLAKLWPVQTRKFTVTDQNSKVIQMPAWTWEGGKPDVNCSSSATTESRCFSSRPLGKQTTTSRWPFLRPPQCPERETKARWLVAAGNYSASGCRDLRVPLTERRIHSSGRANCLFRHQWQREDLESQLHFELDLHFHFDLDSQRPEVPATRVCERERERANWQLAG